MTTAGTKTDTGQLLEQLIKVITGIESDDRLFQKCSKMLQYHLFTSTQEHEIDERWQQLYEKFRIKGHDALAEAIRRLKAEFTTPNRALSSTEQSNERILKYGMLSLLLTLSTSPLSRDTHISTLQPVQTGLSDRMLWEKMTEEEPLEGDHWLQVQDSESIDEDLSETDHSMDDFELDHESLQRRQRQHTADLHPEPSSQDTDRDYIESVRLEKLDQTILQDLDHRQYWSTTYDTSNDSHAKPLTLQNTPHFNATLRSFQGETNAIRYIREMDAIREVLFLLHGQEGPLFARANSPDGSHTFIVQAEKYAVSHLSRTAWVSLLNEFCAFGKMLARLRSFVQSSTSASPETRGQTCQAFATSIGKTLRDWDMFLVNCEKSCASTHDDNSVLSLLQLRSTVDPAYQFFSIISHIISNSILQDSEPRKVSCYLLSETYNRLLQSQDTGNAAIHHSILQLFRDTLVPWGRMMDDWVLSGSLVDSAKEFYLSRDVSIDESNCLFWERGYRLHNFWDDVNTQCPLFDHRFVDGVYFTGKIMHLLSRLERHHHNTSGAHEAPLSKVLSPLFSEKSTLFSIPSHLSSHSGFATSSTSTSSLFLQAGFPLIFGDHSISPMDRTTSHTNAEQANAGPPPLRLFDQELRTLLESYLQSPFQQSAESLNQTLQTECDMIGHVQSLFSVYLMLHNDLMHVFCDLLFTQMDANGGVLDIGQIRSLFIESCASGNWNTHTYTTFFIDAPQNNEHLTAVASFLDHIRCTYQIPHPIHYFIRETCLQSYGRILALLFRLKRAKHVLEHRLLVRSRGNVTMSVSVMRMRLLWFVHSFWSYAMTTILDTETRQFLAALREIKNPDVITELHQNCVARMEDRCLLGQKTESIKKAIFAILDMPEKLYYISESQIQEVEQMEKEFSRTVRFIHTSLAILGKKGGFPWFEALAASLSVA